MPLPLCARVEDDQSAKSLERDGWQQIEVLEIYAGHLKASEVSIPAKRTDMVFCQDLARKSFIADRLHKDPQVSKDEADQAKANFVFLAFNSDKYDVFVIPDIGFSIFDGDAISLIAVGEDYRGQGFGKQLASAKGGTTIAGTQSMNMEAKNLYKSLAMEKVRTLRSFHKWP